MWDATRELLLKETVVFYLSATVDVLCARLHSGTASRPLLNMPGIRWEDALKDLLERRGTYYGLAHYRVETDFHSPADVAKAIVMMREAYD
jgi:shikimate kinase